MVRGCCAVPSCLSARALGTRSVRRYVHGIARGCAVACAFLTRARTRTWYKWPDSELCCLQQLQTTPVHRRRIGTVHHGIRAGRAHGAANEQALAINSVCVSARALWRRLARPGRSLGLGSWRGARAGAGYPQRVSACALWHRLARGSVCRHAPSGVGSHGTRERALAVRSACRHVPSGVSSRCIRHGALGHRGERPGGSAGAVWRGGLAHTYDGRRGARATPIADRLRSSSRSLA
jgi:hypothetical protein